MSRRPSSSSKTIKGLADTFGIIGVGLAVIGGGTVLVFGFIGPRTILIVAGIIIAAIGSWLMYAFTRILYGFGELVSNSEKIAQYLRYLCMKLPKRYDKPDKYDDADDYDEYDDVGDDSVE